MIGKGSLPCAGGLVGVHVSALRVGCENEGGREDEVGRTGHDSTPISSSRRDASSSSADQIWDGNSTPFTLAALGEGVLPVLPDSAAISLMFYGFLTRFTGEPNRVSNSGELACKFWNIDGFESGETGIFPGAPGAPGSGRYLVTTGTRSARRYPRC